MAEDTDLRFNLIARDKASAAFDKVGKAARQAREKVADFNKAGDEGEGATSRLTSGLKKAVGTAATFTAGVGRIAAGVAGLGSVALTAAPALVSAAAAAAQFAAAVAPAAAGLIPLRLGIEFVKQTLKGAGPAMLEAIQPVTDAWKRQQERVGQLASKGLPQLAREFVRVNMPAIAKAQDRIAIAANKAARSTGAWVNSAEGQGIIARFTDRTAAATERLAPKLDQVVKSAARLADRGGDTAFKAFGDAAGWAADRVTNLMDSISAEDVEGAFQRIRDTAKAAGNGLRSIGDGLEWIEQHQATIDRIRLAMAGFAIAAGIAFGPATAAVAVLSGAVTLLAMNWDKVSAAGKKVWAWLKDVGRNTSVQQTLATMRQAWDRVREGAVSFVDQVRPKLEPFLRKAQDGFVKMQPAIQIVTSVLGALLKHLLRFAGFLAGKMIAAAGLFIDALGDVALGAAKMASVVLDVFAKMFAPIAFLAKKLGLPWADSFAGMVNNARNASRRINESIAQVKTDRARAEVDRLKERIRTLRGKKVKTEADKAAIAASMARIRDLQNRINSLPKRRTVTVNTRYTVSYSGDAAALRRGAPSGGGRQRTATARAAGGPAQKGRPYVVGEKRPELFVPDTDGQILPRVPRTATRGRGGGSGVVVNVYVTQPLASPNQIRRVVVDAFSRSTPGAARLPRNAVATR